MEKLNILPVLLHDIQRVNVKSRRILFKVQSLKLFWSDIALHQSIIYKASESLNDALTEVNFFNKSDTKKTLETAMRELEKHGL